MKDFWIVFKAFLIPAIILIVLIFLFACKEKPYLPKPTPTPAPIVEPTPEAIPIQSACKTISQSIKHEFKKKTLWWSSQWKRTITYPATGDFVIESHYATKEDKFGSRFFPKNMTEGINKHLDRSCVLYKNLTGFTGACEEIYNTSYKKVWTPPESGKAGQGSVGNLKPTPSEELFFGTQMWANGQKPPVGQKHLMCRKDKCLVVVFGYETGPAQEKYLGGVTTEVIHYLGSNKGITIELLKDQSLLPGPICCQTITADQ
jgi:hypothetical protein